MQVKSIAECSKGTILQYFRPSLSYHLSLRSLFLSIFEWPFTQVLLYLLTNSLWIVAIKIYTCAHFNQSLMKCKLICVYLYTSGKDTLSNIKGITVFKIFILGRYIVRYMVGNLVLQRRASGAVKHNFRTYIRRYTSQNENFEHGYPHSNALHSLISNWSVASRIQPHVIQRKVT